jgi:hypothetical protein
MKQVIKQGRKGASHGGGQRTVHSLPPAVSTRRAAALRSAAAAAVRVAVSP